MNVYLIAYSSSCLLSKRIAVYLRNSLEFESKVCKFSKFSWWKILYYERRSKRFERERERKVLQKLSASSVKIFERTKALIMVDILLENQRIAKNQLNFCPSLKLFKNWIK